MYFNAVNILQNFILQQYIIFISTTKNITYTQYIFMFLKIKMVTPFFALSQVNFPSITVLQLLNAFNTCLVRLVL